MGWKKFLLSGHLCELNFCVEVQWGVKKFVQAEKQVPLICCMNLLPLFFDLLVAGDGRVGQEHVGFVRKYALRLSDVILSGQHARRDRLPIVHLSCVQQQQQC